MNISLIIPTYNKATYLDIVLYSISYAIKIHQLEVIIIDDGSVDDTRSVIEKYLPFLDIVYIHQRNKGLSSARNTGIINAKYDNLLFIDDDRIIPKEYFNNINKYDFRNVVIGKRKEIYISNIDENFNFIKNKICCEHEYIDSRSLNERYYNKTIEIYSSENNVIPWIGCTFSNTLIHKSLFDIVGLFEEKFVGWGFEDLELAYRLYKQNINFLVNENMYTTHIYHNHGESIFEQRKKNYSLFCLKHPEYPIKLYDSFATNKISLFQYNQLVLESMNNNCTFYNKYSVDY